MSGQSTAMGRVRGWYTGVLLAAFVGVLLFAGGSRLATVITTIRFSQNSASPNFSAGGSIDDLATGLRNGSVGPGDLPPIRIFESKGQWVSLDNRRLVAFQQAGVEVPCRLATAQEIAADTWQVTTNGGTSITIRGGGGTWPR